MRRFFVVFIVCVAAARTLFAQAPDTAWTWTVDRPDYAMAVAAGPSGEVVTAGMYYGAATWRKWDASGNLLDSNRAIAAHSGVNLTDMMVVALCVDGTGDYILGGAADEINPSGAPYLPFAARITSNGTVLWWRVYHCLVGTYYSRIQVIEPRSDGSATLFGIEVGSSQAFAIAVDVSGAPQWCNFYPIRGSGMLATADGGSLLYGSNYSLGDTGMVRIDNQGQIIWASPTACTHVQMLDPDTLLCAKSNGPTLLLFKMTLGGDTAWSEIHLNRWCLKLFAESDGGWSIMGADASGFDWLGRFSSDGAMLWSRHYPVYIFTGTRLGHADYAMVDVINRKVMKTESGPRGAPTKLIIQPNWPDDSNALLSWTGAEWQFYQIYGSPNGDGPFINLGATSDTAFIVNQDQGMQFYHVIGSSDPN
jgi:hypothetical protein